MQKIQCHSNTQLRYVRQKARTQGHVLNNYIIDQGVLTSLDLNIVKLITCVALIYAQHESPMSILKFDDRSDK